MKRTDAAAEKQGLPVVLSLRLSGHRLRPLVKAWAKRNPKKEWSRLVEAGLIAELAPLAGKRYAHLVNGRGRKEAA